MNLQKVIIAPDSFKGTISASQTTDIIAHEVLAVFPGCTVVKMPIADGGEGSMETIIGVLGGEIYETLVRAPDDRQIPAYFGVAADGTGIIEMAQSCGLTKQSGLHPMTSSTYGFGQQLTAALDLGVQRFMLCIGGSATTDAGCGMAAALGVLFLDKRGNSFIPCGETLKDIAHIDTSDLDVRIHGCSFTVMCDVDNPLFGSNGAAYIYAPQKGASSQQVVILDDGLRHLGNAFPEVFRRDRTTTPGAGAAGGLGAGCMVFLSARLMRGSEAILRLSGFREHLVNADLIITGEGQLDEQSFHGKVLSGILRDAGSIPVLSICGVCRCSTDILAKHNLTVFETSDGITAEESMADPARYIKAAAKKAMERYLHNQPREKR